MSSNEPVTDLFGPELSSQFEQLAILSSSLDEVDLDALEETIRAAARLPLDEHTRERFESLLEAWLPEDSDVDPSVVMAILDKYLLDDALTTFSFAEPFGLRLKRIARIFWPQLEPIYEVMHLGSKDWHRVSWRPIQGKLALTIERRDLAVFELEIDPESFVGFIARLLGILAHLPGHLVQTLDDTDWNRLQDMWDHAQEEVRKTGEITAGAMTSTTEAIGES